LSFHRIPTDSLPLPPWETLLISFLYLPFYRKRPIPPLSCPLFHHLQDIQFSREASDVAFDETGNKKRKYRYGDEDEIELEQEEQRRRQQLDKEFQAFATKIANASNGEFEVDIPFRELGFMGVPNRTNVLLQPSTDCLVHLTDQPFTVITLSEVEVCHFERVQHGLKQFDLVFVFTDFTKTPMHINSIPFGQLEGIKEWLEYAHLSFTLLAVERSTDPLVVALLLFLSP
jgi:nucleosome binding factor SPN SPT16 subunit